MRKPVETQTDWFCPDCGRQDAEFSWRTYHFTNGQKCKGKAIKLTYRLEPIKRFCAQCRCIHAPGGNTLCDQ